MRRAALTVLTTLFLISASYGGLIQGVRNRYRGVYTVEGNFTQTAIFPDGRRKVLKGHFWIKGDRSRWDYSPPDEQVVITKGNRVYIYDPFAGQIQEGRLSFSSVYRDVLVNPDRLRENFSLREEGRTLVLVPKQKGQVARIVVRFGADYSIKSILVVDSMGNKSLITFGSLRYNVPINDSMFSIEGLLKGERRSG